MSRERDYNAKLPHLRAFLQGSARSVRVNIRVVARVIFHVISDTGFATESGELRPSSDNVIYCRIA
jgi:hypothetical protein